MCLLASQADQVTRAVCGIPVASNDLLSIAPRCDQGEPGKRYVGKTDEPLTPEAREALKALHLPPVRRVYLSPMLRCMETAAILYPGVPAEAVSGFRECDFGEFEYKNYRALKDRPEYQAWLDSCGRTAFPGGEGRDASAGAWSAPSTGWRKAPRRWAATPPSSPTAAR
jgi:broad specificity phosphatase PhoE